VELIRGILEMSAVIGALRKEDDYGDEIGTSPDGLASSEPLEGKILGNPAIDDATYRRAGGKEEGVYRHHRITFMKKTAHN